MSLYTLAAIVSVTKDGATGISLMAATARAKSIDEALGWFLRDCREKKPTCAILDIACLEIPPDDMRSELEGVWR